MSTMSTERVSALQLVAGFFGFLNALLASLHNAEKSSHLELYVNTHWITTIVIFAGASRLLMIDSWVSEILALLLQLLCFCFAANAMVADFWNLRLLAGLNETTMPSDTPTPSVKLLGMGTALVVLGVIRFVCYFCEFFMLTGQDRLRALFANYTLDEPAWICTQLTLGILCVLSSRGSRMIRAVTLSMAAISLMPSVFYLWLDYRWWASSRLSFGVSAPAYWQALGVLISLCNVGVVTATLIQLIALQCFPRRLALEQSTKRFLFIMAALFLILSCSTISLDAYTIWKKLFYRLFHGAEQKTPFLTGLTAIFALVASKSKYASSPESGHTPGIVVLPLGFCLGLNK
ncbi:unnamed protein product [Nippostrongylus brasiliensis]|uniref:Transmembrane protein n=1 Tax=Nippostrongylus brasiliensis TaxID=27835 RepID=A0A158QWN9_NIPBR|nr:unnamed protein product [Nippostrongylus brasiliensis]